jgi:hypothetical protein
MKTYDTAAPADPFARSRICFESLAEDLASDRTREMTCDPATSACWPPCSAR